MTDTVFLGPTLGVVRFFLFRLGGFFNEREYSEADCPDLLYCVLLQLCYTPTVSCSYCVLLLLCPTPTVSCSYCVGLLLCPNPTVS